MDMQIFAQEMWHSTAFIMADREALEGLRDAINVALVEGVGVTSAFVSYDGEGYDTIVRLCVEDELTALCSHYTDEIAKHDGMRPTEMCLEFIQNMRARRLDEIHKPLEGE